MICGLRSGQSIKNRQWGKAMNTITTNDSVIEQAKKMGDEFTNNQVDPLRKVSELWVQIEICSDCIKSLRLDTMELSDVEYDVLTNIQQQLKFLTPNINSRVRRSETALALAFEKAEGMANDRE